MVPREVFGVIGPRVIILKVVFCCDVFQVLLSITVSSKCVDGAAVLVRAEMGRPCFMSHFSRTAVFRRLGVFLDN